MKQIQNRGPKNTSLQGTKLRHPGCAHPRSKYYQIQINFTKCDHY